MNKKPANSVWHLTLLVLILGTLALSTQLSAQQSTPSPQDPSQQPRQQPSQMPDQAGAQPPDAQAQSQSGARTFIGAIAKVGDKYVLQDSDSGTTYDVDHQDQVKQFEGKKVRIHGTLDPSSKMIHIQ